MMMSRMKDRMFAILFSPLKYQCLGVSWWVWSVRVSWWVWSVQMCVQCSCLLTFCNVLPIIVSSSVQCATHHCVLICATCYPSLCPHLCNVLPIIVSSSVQRATHHCVLICATCYPSLCPHLCNVLPIIVSSSVQRATHHCVLICAMCYPSLCPHLCNASVSCCSFLGCPDPSVCSRRGGAVGR